MTGNYLFQFLIFSVDSRNEIRLMAFTAEGKSLFKVGCETAQFFSIGLSKYEE